MRLAIVIVLLIALTPSFGLLAETINNDGIAAAYQQQRLAAAQPIELASPGLVISNAIEADLLIVSRVAYPLGLEVSALDSEGSVLPLGSVQLMPRNHLVLPLTEQVLNADAGFEKGSIRVSYLGDSEMIQAWLLSRVGHQIHELELESVGASSANEFLAFWDKTLTRGNRPKLFFLNAGEAPMGVEISAHTGDSPQSHHRWLLDPGQSAHWQPESGQGWAEISQDGLPGTLLVVGRISGPRFLGTLPVFENRSDAGATLERFSLHSVPAPLAFGEGESLSLTLFNSTEKFASAEVLLQAAENQEILFQDLLHLPPGGIRTIPFNKMSSVLDPRANQEARITILTATPGLLAYGFSTTGADEVVDLAFFPRSLAHDGGIYPLFPLESHKTYTHLVNLGTESSTIVAQFWWPGGTYSYGPVTIPSGGSYRIDVQDIVQQQKPDLLGRTLAPDFRSGLFRWRVHGGSRALLGRTEIQRRGSRDSFGLNCLSCCHEVPSGTVVPSVVDFFPGQTPTFQSCVTYNTCVGTEGPFPTIADSINSPAPFNWNGSSISASDAAKDKLSFTGAEEGITLMCQFEVFPIEGRGTGNTCKELLRKPHDPLSIWDVFKKCTEQLSDVAPASRCSSCQSCCNQILAWKECTKVGLLSANSDHQGCLTNCATELGCN